MVFSSLFFTFIFLPIVVILYYIAKDGYRNYLLLLASIFFYSYGEPTFVFIMLALILVNYFFAMVIAAGKDERWRKLFLTLCVTINIGILFVFKYLDFAITISNYFLKTALSIKNIALPVGISFFTFQAISYVIDVYRGTVPVQRNPLYVALYVSFFPQLIAGPIVRYSSIADQLSNRVTSIEKFGEGSRRFFCGFAKKVILANNLALVAESAFGMDPTAGNPVMLWLGSICYSLQIFYDFSGYSDMAIGLGKMFGFEFEENFDYPYISKSVTEFWRRWHISLGQWFRDYVYIPLGGARVSVHRHIFNMFVVWLLTGIWHGANHTFVVWGMWYFILLVIEKYFIKPEKRISGLVQGVWRIVTLLCVNFGWVIFNSSTLHQGVQYCLGMLGLYHKNFEIDAQVIRCMREYGIFLILGIVFAMPSAEMIKKYAAQKGIRFAGLIVPIGYALVFLWAVSYIILGAHNPFIYFNF